MPMDRRTFVAGGAASLLAPANAPAAAKGLGPVGPTREWRFYNGDAASTHYSPLDQITPGNVAELRVAWQHLPEEGARARGMFECTPIVVDGVMYIAGSRLRVQALEAATGKLIWSQNPLTEVSSTRAAGVSRGVTYWRDGDDERIFAPVRDRLLGFDAKTGEPLKDFGKNGAVDLTQDLDRDITGLNLFSTTPGAVYKDLIIVTSRPDEGPRRAAPGHIRAYDVHTGKRRWIFHTIPHPGEFGHDTWSPDSWKTSGGANCWGGMSVDHERDLVYIPTGSPTFDFWGGDRVGKNLFGNCILCLNAETGERVWHFQTVHHDLWDYDVPGAPQLVSVMHEGRPRDIVAQVSKTGWVYLLDRETGEPLYPIEERPVPPSDVAGEKAWPTQPYPAKPPAFCRQEMSPNDLSDISPEANAYLKERFKNARFGKMFVPPGERETIAVPGYHGGGLWGGASWDAGRGWLFINSNEIPWSIHLVDAKPDSGYPFEHTGYIRLRDEEGYPAIKPPWGQIVAMDLNKCEIVWTAPLGEYKELTKRGIGPTGTYNRGGNIATKGGVLFASGTLDNTFRAFEAATGKVLWEAALKGGGFSTPSTYEAGGKQYVTISVSPSRSATEGAGPGLVVYALP